MKKFLALLLTAVLAVGCLAFVGCSETEAKFDPVAKEDLKIGLITLHDDQSTYDKNFIDAMYRALDNLGIKKEQLVLKPNIEEDTVCYDSAKACVTEGCQVVFADSFGHEDYIYQAAIEYPNVRFCHATGTKAHTEKVANFSNAFASIYEGRYLAGVAAGMKLNEMINSGKITADKAKMGYVGAYTYAEVISGYTSFYLGAKSVCPTVTMEVKFTGEWFDIDKEMAAANDLIKNGCVLISQHADSYGAPQACEAAGVPNVSYNGSTIEAGRNTYLVSSKIDWTPYFEYMIKQVIAGKQIAYDWTGTLETGSVKVEVEDGANNQAAGTKAKIEEVTAKLKSGEIKVFDTSTFTVTKKDKLNVNATVDNNGKLLEYMADVNFDKNFTADTQVVKNGVFLESDARSAPYFDVQIDGIVLLNSAT